MRTFERRSGHLISEGMSFVHSSTRSMGSGGDCGTSRAWRTDWMATVVYTGTDRITTQIAQATEHDGVEVWACPPRRPQRKGVIENAIQYVTRS